MKKILLLFFVLLITCSYNGISKGFFDKLPDKDELYVITLKNGDVITGNVVEFVNHPEEGEGIKFSTELGTATIYENQIKDFKSYHEFYKHNHRIFILPTAEPIGNNHFIGNFELLMFYAGAGIFDVASITAGRTFLPGIRSDQQITIMNLKFTLLQMPLGAPARKLSLAVGSNLGFINHNNRLLHFYGVGTLALNRTSVSGTIFVKSGSQDFNEIRVGQNSLALRYPDGSFGLAIGIDTKFSDLHDLHFIGELWNSDVTRPTNSAVMLGLRLAGRNFSSDFGLAFFTEPFVAPFCSFVWTPFN